MELLSVRQIAEQYPALPESSLRYLLLHRDENGLSKTVVRVGRRIFIDRGEFNLWLENQKEKEK